MADSFGCQFYHDCFSCPFPECLVDRIPSVLVSIKRAEARELAEQGMSKAQIAQRLGVAERTVRYYLAKIS